MEVLDTTIAVVALRYIAGGLSATVNDGEWVITSYLAANAIILPITGWLINRFGRRNYFLASIAVFTVASGLCGIATSLSQLILFRVIQGLAGGGLQPCSQGVLLDAFPREKQGTAMTLFGLAALIAPVVGPSLGGWITDNYSWRWVFYINLPVGLLAFAACYAVVHDPEYLTAQRAEQRRQPSRFDSIGLSLLVITMVCWEVMLSKGEEWNWLGDAFWRVQTLAALFVLALAGLIFWECATAAPLLISGRCGSAISAPAASLFSAPMRCFMVTAPYCLAFFNPCLATMRCRRGWSCHRRVFLPSSRCPSWPVFSAGRLMHGG